MGETAQPAALEVRALRNLADLKIFATRISALNLAARRPTPFHTVEYLEAFAAHDEYAVAGTDPLLLVALEGPRLIGLLPLKRVPERVLGLATTRIAHFTTHDSERPYLVAAPQDEERCADAFLHHLLEIEKGWSSLELVEQDRDSALERAAARVKRPAFYVRRYPNNANATIRLAGGFEAWFHSLKKEVQSQLQRRTRALLSAGAASYVSTYDRDAVKAMLPLYLELEARSWKLQAHAGISRHPARVKLFEAMLEPQQAGTPLFQWLLLDGLPIAGLLSLQLGPTTFQMEIAHDESFRDLAPGNVLVILSVREVSQRGSLAYDMLGNFAYHKARLGAEITATHAVQVYRRLGLPYLKAVMGELKRMIKGAAPSPLEVRHNPSKKPAAPEAAKPPDLEQQQRARTHAAEVFSRFPLERLEGDALRAALPFKVTPGGRKVA